MIINLKNVPEIYTKTIRKTVEDFFVSNKLSAEGTVNLEFVNRKRITELNKKYRKINTPTDVLSFPIFDRLKDIPKKSPYILGDIVICPTETNIDQELSNLVVHSLNHLIGKHH